MGAAQGDDAIGDEAGSDPRAKRGGTPLGAVSLLRVAEETGRSLLDRRLTVGLAESCTGGLVAKLLTDVPGSSRYVKGCVVSYSNESKERILGVGAESIERYGAVSEPVATEMAVGAARVLGADIGIGVTGIAGPDGGTNEKPVGTVWFGLFAKDRTIAHERRFPGGRSDVRSAAARFALELIQAEAKDGGTDAGVKPSRGEPV